MTTARTAWCLALAAEEGIVTFDELKQSLEAAKPPEGPLMLRALWLAKKGDWDGAHRIVSDSTTETAARIHAHLHRVEGDLSNARYWYGQAHVAVETSTLEAEWEKLARELTGT
jgi:hypothetical protein